MNIKSHLIRYGFRKTIYDIFLRVNYKITKGQFFYCFELPSDHFYKKNLNINESPYLFGFMELDQLLDVINTEEMTMTPYFAEQAYSKGNRCFGVIDNNFLAHYSWYATSPTHVVDNLIFHFPSNNVYMFNAFTSPRYRGQRLYPMAVTRAIMSYFEHGITSALTIIAANNFSSISAVEQIGFSTLGKFYTGLAGGSHVYASKECTKRGVKLTQCL